MRDTLPPESSTSDIPRHQAHTAPPRAVGVLALATFLVASAGCGSDPAPGQTDTFGAETTVKTDIVDDIAEQVDANEDTSVALDDCTSNLDCAGGEICRDSFCRTACTTADDCAAPLPACDTVAGYCVTCVTADDCGPSRICEDGGCTFFCDDDAACAATEFCNFDTGACLERECERSSECAGGYRCDRYTCKPIDPIICESNAVGCDTAANAVTSCNADGTKETVEPCGEARLCIAADGGASCVDIVCEPNEIGCIDAESAFECNGTGTNQAVTPCGNTHACVEGVCQALVCSPGTTRCEGAGVMACHEDGLGETFAACGEVAECETSAFGCGCQTGACKPRLCAPDSTRCAGIGVQSCAPDGYSWLTSTACPQSESCIPALNACAEVVCSPASRTCFGETLAICDATGTQRATTDCAESGGFCDAQAAAASCKPQVCEPNAAGCDGDRLAVTTCDSRGASFVSTNCLDTEVCFDATCVDEQQVCPIADIDVLEGQQVLLQTVLHLSGAGSEGTLGAPVQWEWTVTQPSGSTSTFLPDANRSEVTFEVSTVGEYVFSLRVWDEFGIVSCEAATYTVTVVSDVGIRVELVWHTPGDADETDTGISVIGNSVGSDVDLHLLHQNAAGTWFQPTFDCMWLNTTPEWGGSGLVNNPEMVRDDTDGAGPEVIVLKQPESGVTYRVGVHYWDDWEFGASEATVRVYIYGVLVEEWIGIEIVKDDMWEVLTIAWPSRVVTRLGADGEPSITHNYRSPLSP